MMILSFSISVSAAEDQPFASYSYTRSGDFVEAPNPYLLDSAITLKDSKGSFLNYPTDFIFLADGKLVVTDKGNNRIICYKTDFTIDWELSDVEGTKLFKPNSVSVDSDGNLYICDEGEQDAAGNSLGNGRIIKLSKDLGLLKIFGKPEARQLLNEKGEFHYYPQKVAIDDAGRMYIIARNINQGFIQLDSEGNFQGFLGAPKVKSNPIEVIKRFLSTKEQRSRMAVFIPTEYKSVDIDSSGFLYAVTNSYAPEDIYNTLISQRNVGALKAPATIEMVRKLNPSGADILKRTGGFSPIGDIHLPSTSFPGSPVIDRDITLSEKAVMGPSRFSDIKVIENGIYFVLDGKRNRIFAYDNDSNILMAFGSKGVSDDSFSDPVAIEYHAGNLYVLNSSTSSISILKPTQAGNHLISASRAQVQGDFDTAKKLWTGILENDANSEISYFSLGKLAFYESDYKKAMDYFKLADNRENYSKAYEYYRNERIDENFMLLIGVIFAAIVVLILAVFLQKKAVKASPRYAAVSKKTNFIFYSAVHPFDGFYDLKYEKRGSFSIGVFLFALMAVVFVLKKNASAYIFNTIDLRYVNIVFDYLTVILPYLLFAISSWCLTTLMDGKGTFKDIITYIGYATVPLTIATLLSFGISFIATMDEGILITLIEMAGLIWTLFLLFAGTMSTHVYSGAKTVLTILFSIFGIIIIIVILLFFTSIINDIISFVEVSYTDLSVR